MVLIYIYCITITYTLYFTFNQSKESSTFSLGMQHCPPQDPISHMVGRLTHAQSKKSQRHECILTHQYFNYTA